MWADIIQLLREALDAALNVPDPDTGEVAQPVTVVAHADAEIPEVDTVRVLRGVRSGPIYPRPTGTLDFNLELWTTAADPAVADQRLQALETAVVTGLLNIRRDTLILKTDILGIDPDGDLFRPTVGSNLRLRVSYRLKQP